MKVEKPLEKWEKEIDKRWIKHKLKFLWYGFWGDFKGLREVVEFEEPRRNKIEAFIGICDNRIDRLKSFSRDLITFISVSAASLGIILVFASEKHVEANRKFHEWLPGQLDSFIQEKFPILLWILLGDTHFGIRLVLIVLFILILLFALLVWRYRAQVNAWYAIKEGLLLMKKNK